MVEYLAHSNGHRLTLRGITHRFGEFTAVRQVALDIAGGELVALLGPSRCGKSTLLRIVAGFISQSEGVVLCDDEPVDHLIPNRCRAGIGFPELRAASAYHGCGKCRLRSANSPRAQAKNSATAGRNAAAGAYDHLVTGCRRSSPGASILADERTEVLPIHLWQQIDINLDVRTAAVYGLIVVATILPMFLAERFAGLSRQIGEAKCRLFHTFVLDGRAPCGLD